MTTKGERKEVDNYYMEVGKKEVIITFDFLASNPRSPTASTSISPSPQKKNPRIIS